MPATQCLQHQLLGCSISPLFNGAQWGSGMGGAPLRAAADEPTCPPTVTHTPATPGTSQACHPLNKQRRSSHSASKKSTTSPSNHPLTLLPTHQFKPTCAEQRRSSQSASEKRTTTVAASPYSPNAMAPTTAISISMCTSKTCSVETNPGVLRYPTSPGNALRACPCH